MEVVFEVRSVQRGGATSILVTGFDDLFANNMHVRQAVPWRDGREADFVAVSTLLCKYQNQPDCRDFRFPSAEKTDQPENCPACGGNLRYGKGWSVPSDWSTNVTTTALTARGVAMEQNLFSREVNNRESPYYDMAVKWITTDRRISIGGKRSVLGRVSWKATKMDTPPPNVTPPQDSNLVALYLRTPAMLVYDLGFPVLDLK